MMVMLFNMISLFLLGFFPMETLSFKAPFRIYSLKRSIHSHRHDNIAQASIELHSTSSSSDNQGDNDNDNDNDDDNTEKEISDYFLLESLRERKKEIQSETEEIEKMWRNADCRTSVPIQMDDWIRRIALDKWPIVAIGTASGSVAVSDLSTGKVLASVLSIHEQFEGDPEVLELLYGQYDGGGVMAIAMRDNIVVSAGREGGMNIWKFDPISNELILQGQPSSLEGVQVTSIVFDENNGLWAGCFDKKLRKFVIDTTSTQFKIAKPTVIECISSIVCLATNSDIGLCVCGMADGSIHFISSSDCELLSSWKPFKNTCARSVAIIALDDDTYNVVCGGSDGTMHIRSLAVNIDGEISSESFQTTSNKVPHKLSPPHNGPVVAIAARKGGVFVTGAIDGSLRIWDCVKGSREDTSSSPYKLTSTPKPKPQAIARYHLLGYKVWLGSICIDEEGQRLFSDGMDNSIVVHDFSVIDQADE